MTRRGFKDAGTDPEKGHSSLDNPHRNDPHSLALTNSSNLIWNGMSDATPVPTSQRPTSNSAMLEDNWFHESCVQQVWSVYRDPSSMANDGEMKHDLKRLAIFLQSNDVASGPYFVYDPSVEQRVYSIWNIVAMIDFFNDMSMETFRKSHLIGVTMKRMQRELVSSDDMERCFFAGWCMALLMCRVRQCSKSDGSFAGRIDLDGNCAYTTLSHWWEVLDHLHNRKMESQEVDLKPLFTSFGKPMKPVPPTSSNKMPTNLFDVLAEDDDSCHHSSEEDESSAKQDDAATVRASGVLVKKLPHDAIFTWFCFEYQHHWNRILPVFVMQHFEQLLSSVNVQRPVPSECAVITCLDVLTQASNYMFAKTGKTGWHNKLDRLDAWCAIASRFIGSNLDDAMLYDNRQYAPRALLASLRMLRHLLIVIHRLDKDRLCFYLLGPLQSLVQHVVLSEQYPSAHLVKIVSVSLSCITSIVKTRDMRALRSLVKIHLLPLAVVFGHCLRSSLEQATNYWTHIRQALLTILRPLQHADQHDLRKEALLLLDSQYIPVMCRTHVFVDHLTTPTTICALPHDLDIMFSHENSGRVFQNELDELRRLISSGTVSPDDFWTTSQGEGNYYLEQMARSIFHIPPSNDQVEKTLAALLNLERPNFSIDAVLHVLNLRFDVSKPVSEHCAWIAGVKSGLRPTTLANYIPVPLRLTHNLEYGVAQLADLLVTAFLAPWQKRNGFISCSWLNRTIFGHDEQLLQHWLDCRNKFGADYPMGLEERVAMIGTLLKLWCAYVEHHVGVDVSRHSEVLRRFWESDCEVIRSYYHNSFSGPKPTHEAE